jgi:hypothetical protein
MHRTDRRNGQITSRSTIDKIPLVLKVTRASPSEHNKEGKLAERQIKMPARKNIVKEEAAEVVSQRQKPDTGRYLLQVDRQTKGSFQTSEAAQSAALEIKKAFPVLQVSIYDNVTHLDTRVKVS